MAKKMPDTPMLDQLESGPWPSFVSGLKRLANSEDKPYAAMMKDLLGQLELSYETRKGYWKGGTVGVRGYGGGVMGEWFEHFPGTAPSTDEPRPVTTLDQREYRFWFLVHADHEAPIAAIDTNGSGWVGDDRFDFDKVSDRHGFLTQLMPKALGDPS